MSRRRTGTMLPGGSRTEHPACGYTSQLELYLEELIQFFLTFPWIFMWTLSTLQKLDFEFQLLMSRRRAGTMLPEATGHGLPAYR